jgi:hypothetical protein
MPRPDIEQMEGGSALRRWLGKATYLINIDVILQAIIAQGRPLFVWKPVAVRPRKCAESPRQFHPVRVPS